MADSAEHIAAIQAAEKRAAFEGKVLQTLEDMKGDIRHIRVAQASLPDDYVPRRELELQQAQQDRRIKLIEQTQGWFVRKLLTAALGGGSLTAAGASAALYFLGLKVGK